MKCYSIYDAAAQYYLPPFFAKNDAHAKRMFIQSLGDSFQFRSDFNLICIGTFDDDSGVFEVLNSTAVLHGQSVSADLDPRNLATANEQENVQ